MTITVLPRLLAEVVVPTPQDVCISITNPKQSEAKLEGWGGLLRQGFHDTDRIGGGFTIMSLEHARDVLLFAHQNRSASITVHCEAGASRSVGVGVFLAAWRQAKLSLVDDVIFPNPLVIQQLRLAGLSLATRIRDFRLLKVCVQGPMAFVREFAAPGMHIPHIHSNLKDRHA